MSTSSEPSKPSETRRAHKKSRTGCLVCKQRRVKCDEVRPQCGKCAVGGRACSYAAGRNPAPSSGIDPGAPVLTGLITPGVSALTQRLAAQASLGVSPQGPDADRPPDIFTAFHMALLFHASTSHGTFLPTSNFGHLFISKALEFAQDAPYFLEQVLALAALHLSTTNKDKRAIYRQQATVLQNRALGMFKARPDGADAHLEANFLFTATVGMQVLGETLTDHMASIGDFLGAFVNYTRIHRGVRVVISTRWLELLSSNIGPMLRHLGSISDQHGPDSGPETDMLRLKLETIGSQPEPSAVTSTCLEALRWTQRLMDSSRTDMSNIDASINAAIAWPMIVSEDYIESVYQHRPEALAVLAFYGAMLHQSRRFWVFGDHGAALVSMIVEHVGPFWAESLAWPMEVASGHEVAVDAVELPLSRDGSSVNTPMSY